MQTVVQLFSDWALESCQLHEILRDNSQTEDMLDKCFLCGHDRDLISCPKCGQVAFCGPEHGSLHSDEELEECYPYKVDHKEGVGRCLVATRQIEAGQLIFKETPLTVGPLHETKPVCLVCWKTVDGSYQCKKCKLPMCSLECAEAEIHTLNECFVFGSQHRPPIQISAFDQFHPFYQCITPLRSLKLKERHPEKWRALEGMMDHCEDRPKDIHYEVNQKNIVQFLRDHWNVPYSVEEINHVIGALEVNAFEVSGVGGGRGVFPLTALMSHCCISNTRYTMYDDYHTECRANVAIELGDEITDFYVSPLHGTQYRRTHLRDGWFFHCQCLRCQDPTECGSYQDAHRCGSSGCKGNVISLEPLNYESDFKCDQCDFRLTRKEREQVEDGLTEQLDAIDKNDDEGLEKLLESALLKVQDTHFIVTAIKRYLIYIYGRVPGRMLHQMSMEGALRKRTLCRDLLAIYDIIVPGLTRERGLTLFELKSVEMYLVKKSLEGFFDLTKAEKLKRLELCSKLLRESQECLQYESSDTFENMVYQAAVKQLRECDDLLTIIQLMP